MREIVEHIPSPEGSARITIYRRPDGLYEYSHDKFFVDDLPQYDHHLEYWAPGPPLGIFDSAETARREASAWFSWAAGGNAKSENSGDTTST